MAFGIGAFCVGEINKLKVQGHKTKIRYTCRGVAYLSRTYFIGPGIRVAWHQMKVSINLQNIFDSFHVKKLPQNVQAATFHGDGSGVPPQDPKTPFHRATPPGISALILTLRPYSHTKFTYQ